MKTGKKAGILAKTALVLGLMSPIEMQAQEAINYTNIYSGKSAYNHSLNQRQGKQYECEEEFGTRLAMVGGVLGSYTLGEETPSLILESTSSWRNKRFGIEGSVLYSPVNKIGTGAGYWISGQAVGRYFPQKHLFLEFGASAAYRNAGSWEKTAVHPVVGMGINYGQTILRADWFLREWMTQNRQQGIKFEVRNDFFSKPTSRFGLRTEISVTFVPFTSSPAGFPERFIGTSIKSFAGLVWRSE